MEPLLPSVKNFRQISNNYNSYTQKFLNEDEKEFAKKVQEVWIEFATAKSPEEPYLPRITQSTHSTASGTTMAREDLKEGRQSEAIVFEKTFEVTRTSSSPVTRMSDNEIDFYRKKHAFVTEMYQCGRGLGFGTPPIINIRITIETNESVARI
ncbi:hypothetical protein BX616_003942 [Lobosporangium transversale]|uniref:Uncharacterized protein n=1 Tax=Lobosporangium transversale TaxID=64571 RepID=A0A1Y2GP40_9FUNG|nr:hypothetical protein BCR41DRAFT_395698 [Lobosporangium transversale]KAF9898499.1 hypothetical protein BX616_003942 [Lobosporangium transversale]ORZ17417.1 hypothetical protein BCR41DRAFT_395698 [Lobosporangium transversale]|eukprot:XP_021881804.1 hypothetical protein BCR41DRAFT_395698 [Lobosporangium transversale]